MFEIPSDDKVSKVIITKDCVNGKKGPKIVTNEKVASIKGKTSKRKKVKSEDETA